MIYTFGRQGEQLRAVILQPHFLPFVGYFDLMNRADVFVYYDTVQFRRRSWHCRTLIAERNIAKWLSAPVCMANGSRMPLYEAVWANDTRWRQKAVRRLRHCYAQTPQADVLDTVAELILSGPTKLSDWNILANNTLASLLGIKTATLRSSQLARGGGDKQQRLIDICRQVGATRYLCGPGSRNYVSESFFARADIEVEWLDYDYEGRLLTEGGGCVHPSVIHPILELSLERTRHILINRAPAEAQV
jgi:hypothetical protein